MKTSSVLASLLFGSLAVAAPFDKRALVYKTEVVTETVVVYTTVYDDEPVPQATTTPAGNFYEQPQVSSTVSSSSSSSSSPAPAYTPPPAPASSSVYVAPPPASTPPPPPPAQSPAPVSSVAPVVPEQPAYTPAPQPQPTPSPVAPPPAPASSAAPAPSSAPPANPPPSNGGGGTGEFSGDITIYEPNGNSGACGKNLGNEEMVVALSKETWGASTYNVMTGESTNPWCGQKINVFYQGRTVSATIMDLCPECKGHDIDLAPAPWRQLTGSDEKTRYKATWSKA